MAVSTFMRKLWAVDLPQDARLLGAYLATGPHTDRLNAPRVPPWYAIGDLGLDENRYQGALSELMSAGLVRYCPQTHRNHLVGMLRRAANPNVATGRMRLWRDLPASSVVRGSLALELLDLDRERLDEVAVQALEKAAKPAPIVPPPSGGRTSEKTDRPARQDAEQPFAPTASAQPDASYASSVRQPAQQPGAEQPGADSPAQRERDKPLCEAVAETTVTVDASAPPTANGTNGSDEKPYRDPLRRYNSITVVEHDRAILAQDARRRASGIDQDAPKPAATHASNLLRRLMPEAAAESPAGSESTIKPHPADAPAQAEPETALSRDVSRTEHAARPETNLTDAQQKPTTTPVQESVQAPEDFALESPSAAPPSTREKPKSPASLTWEAYAAAYAQRYGAEPVRNAKTNGQCAHLVSRIGADEAPQVARWYVGQGGFYAQRCHPMDLLVKDAETLRTRWATNRPVDPAGRRRSDDEVAGTLANKGIRAGQMSQRSEAALAALFAEQMDEMLVREGISLSATAP
ncbi:hypothetical protein BI364_06930 [Acidihalobacter yilgarnensis]|uniref:DnaT DNA-binding domain-containing protein n=1 Tax=Acidihalobacter yilgarnensis TaxID=2819280 RepID=A0A1D8IMN1_9GAMM|nr:hypothetical protein [Acidihalobacter yilgarnensis]AOU97727.1 hypothetical protein BI364_06930 [Acidihalobacter yilgarnensis]